MLIALRYYFDLVCPYSYTIGFEVEEAEDEGVVEIEWLPFELRPVPVPLPEPRGEYIRDHWRGQVYRLALEHGVEIHVPRYQPRSTLALTLHLFAVEEGKGRAFRDRRAHEDEVGDPHPSNYLEHDSPGLHDHGQPGHGRQHVGNDAEGTAEGREQAASPATADRTRDRVDHPGARDKDHDERRQQELDGHAREARRSWITCQQPCVSDVLSQGGYREPPRLPAGLAALERHGVCFLVRKYARQV